MSPSTASGRRTRRRPHRMSHPNTASRRRIEKSSGAAPATDRSNPLWEPSSGLRHSKDELYRRRNVAYVAGHLKPHGRTPHEASPVPASRRHRSRRDRGRDARHRPVSAGDPLAPVLDLPEIAGHALRRRRGVLAVRLRGDRRQVPDPALPAGPHPPPPPAPPPPPK